jgi:DNA repair protein RadA/Sms
MRGERLGLRADDLWLLAETAYDALLLALEGKRLDVVVIDSIQTMYCSEIPSGAGSVTQVREITNRLLALAKTRNITVALVGHITKAGHLAGPKTLEHMVDGVFYFEGDKYHHLRLIRAQKNRFGPAQELGIFRMSDRGLEEVDNPSKVLLEQRPKACAGSVVVPCLEGTRPLMVEVQVLLSNSTYASPRRVTMGVDGNRLALIMAVLEKKAGVQLQGLDVFVNIVGGLSIQEPALDLGLALAIYSSFRNLAFDEEVAVFGELGLAGEVRSVSQADLRLKECRNLGFSKVICPTANSGDNSAGVSTVGVATLVEALEHAL